MFPAVLVCTVMKKLPQKETDNYKKNIITKELVTDILMIALLVIAIIILAFVL